MSAVKQNCGNCSYSSRWRFTPTGRFVKDTVGLCSAPVVISIQPDSVQHITESRYGMLPTEGTDCKAWKTII